MARTIKNVKHEFDLFERANLESILNYVAVQTGINKNDILRPTRQRDIVKARELVYYAMYEGMKFTLTEIAIVVNKDHSTVWNALQNIKESKDENIVKLRTDILIFLDPKLKDEHRIVKFMLKNGIRITDSIPHAGQILRSIEHLLANKGYKLAIKEIKK